MEKKYNKSKCAETIVKIINYITFHHREYTVLLCGMKVNKGMKKVNSLPLSPVVISYANLHVKPLPSCPAKHCSAKLVPRPSRVVQTFFWFIYNLIIYKNV